MKSTVNKYANRVKFAFNWRQAGKISVKSSKCFLAVESSRKQISIFGYQDVKKW